MIPEGDGREAIDGLNFGADDYLIKPISSSTLLIRVKVLLEQRICTNIVMKASHIQLNTVTHETISNGNRVPLTATEYLILEFLMQNKNQAVSREVLTKHVWGKNFETSMSNLLDVNIKNLRKKISVNGTTQIITTIRGFGFRLDG